jgi:hypothetical protein
MALRIEPREEGRDLSSAQTTSGLAVAKEVNQEVENKPGPSNGHKHHQSDLQDDLRHDERVSRALFGQTLLGVHNL